MGPKPPPSSYRGRPRQGRQMDRRSDRTSVARHQCSGGQSAQPGPSGRGGSRRQPGRARTSRDQPGMAGARRADPARPIPGQRSPRCEGCPSRCPQKGSARGWSPHPLPNRHVKRPQRAPSCRRTRWGRWPESLEDVRPRVGPYCITQRCIGRHGAVRRSNDNPSKSSTVPSGSLGWRRRASSTISPSANASRMSSGSTGSSAPLSAPLAHGPAAGSARGVEVRTALRPGVE